MRRALHLSLGYLVVGITWILATTWLAQSSSDSVGQLVVAEWLKGVFFIVASATLLFVFARRQFAQMEQRAEEEIRSQTRLLEAERRAVAGMLAASLAHDSRNLLTVVTAGLPENSSDPLARDIRKAAKDLTGLLRGLSDLGRSITEPARTEDLGAIVEGFVALDRTHHRVRGCRITVHRTPGTLRVKGVGIHQIVLNLLLNAGDATGGKGSILVVAGVGADGVGVLEVHDDGPGIPEAMRARLLSEVVTTKADGTGVGLLSVKQCAERHGGDVSIVPSSLGGAAFRVSLRDCA